MHRLAVLLAALWLALPVWAHPVRPAVADIEVRADEVLVQLRLPLEPLLAGLNLAGLGDTDESPLSGLHDQFRALPPDAVAARFKALWPRVAANIRLESGGTWLVPELTSVALDDPGDPTLPRPARIIMTAPLPEGDAPVTFGWAQPYGPLILRQAGAGDLYAGMVMAGETSPPLPRQGVVRESGAQTFARFVRLGVVHIVPEGLDHILFVLGLFFFSLSLRPLLAQITAFTAAHTVTLALASLGVVSVPARIVEPLIAASIVLVALENLRGGPVTWHRIALVFGFGLLHGLGFAGVLRDLDLPQGRFIAGLLGFNVGVEIGQVIVILTAWLALAVPFGRRPWYRRAIALPASAAIAATGAWWVVERTLL